MPDKIKSTEEYKDYNSKTRENEEQAAARERYLEREAKEAEEAAEPFNRAMDWVKSQFQGGGDPTLQKGGRRRKTKKRKRTKRRKSKRRRTRTRRK